jgi:hypothetical protein
MFGRKFGLKEAKAASQFTKTEDTRRSVLGILGVFGIKNTVEAEASKVCRRNDAKIERAQNTMVKLSTKHVIVSENVITLEHDTDIVQDVVRDWVL